MDSSLTVKPRAALRDYGRPRNGRADARSAEAETPPAPSAVEQVAETQAVQDALTHDLVDSEGRDLIFRAREERDRRRRTTDDALLRQRVYAQPDPHAPEQSSDTQKHTDIEV